MAATTMRILIMALTALQSKETIPGLPTEAATCHKSGSVASAGPDTLAWTTLAVASLLLAGLLSLSVVIGRLPPFNTWIADPLFFKRCLVVHVDLALLVWFYTFLGALLAMRTPSESTIWGRWCGMGASGGILLILAGAVVPGAEPVLANYIPVIDHPLFLYGLGLFFASLVVYSLHHLLRPATADDSPLLPADTEAGLLAAAVAIILALTTWIAAQAGMQGGLGRPVFFELSMWGAGHALQVANICAMVAAWFWLLNRATGSSVLSPRAARWLFIILLVPHFALPLLSAGGTGEILYVNGSTMLMRWGLFPVLAVVLLKSLHHLYRHRGCVRGDGAKTALAGFQASAGLTLLGLFLGALIRDSSTLIPAHYHASLGGVTASFMAGAYLIAERASGGRRFHHWHAARRQLLLFGIGQAVFASGFAIGGLYGLGRKTYAGEQIVRGSGETIGLTVMGVGGLMAAAAGVWFLVIIIGSLRRWWCASLFPSTNPNAYE